MTHEELKDYKDSVLKKIDWSEMYAAQSAIALRGIFEVLCEILNELQNQRRPLSEQREI